MKFFHLSDMHIGLTLCGRDLYDDQSCILDKIVDAAKSEQPDAILIAGDIYDRAVPSAEAVSLCNDFLVKLAGVMEGKPIMVISGNHDSCDRIDYLSGLVSNTGVYMVGNPPRFEDEYIRKVTLKDEHGDVNFYLLPFVKPSMVKNITGVDADGRNYSCNDAIRLLLERESVNKDVRNVIVSHQFYCPMDTDAAEFTRTDSEIKVVGNIDAVSSSHLKDFDYAALGHIHTPMKLGSETIRYSGTPMACSVSEAGQEKGIVVVELNQKGTDANIRTIPLIPRYKVRKIEGLLEDILKQPSDDYVSIVLTDKDEGIAQFNRDRIKAAFPQYLEINIKRAKSDERSQELNSVSDMEPLDFCKKFAPELTEEELDILSELINSIKEG